MKLRHRKRGYTRMTMQMRRRALGRTMSRMLKLANGVMSGAEMCKVRSEFLGYQTGDTIVARSPLSFSYLRRMQPMAQSLHGI